MTPERIPTSMETVYDLPAHMAQPVAGEIIAHEAIDGTLELWEIAKVETVKGSEGDVARCSCFRVYNEPEGVNSYLVSDIAFAQVEKVLANLKERDVKHPSAAQVLASIHTVERSEN